MHRQEARGAVWGVAGWDSGGGSAKSWVMAGVVRFFGVHAPAAGAGMKVPPEREPYFDCVGGRCGVV